MRDIMLVIHFIGLAMGVGTSFAHAFLGKTMSKLKQSEKAEFRHKTRGLSQMGTIGTILLFVSGVYLILPYWPAITRLPFLILKLVLFLILVVLIFLINQTAKRNLKNKTEDNLKGIELMGQLAMILGVVIVILAVIVFH